MLLVGFFTTLLPLGLFRKAEPLFAYFSPNTNTLNNPQLFLWHVLKSYCEQNKSGSYKVPTRTSYREATIISIGRT